MVKTAVIVLCHVLNKIKINEGNGPKLKSQIVPHGSEDSLKYKLRSDCSMCTPTDIQILNSLSTIKNCRLTRVDVKSAFFQTGAAERRDYVIPPRDLEDRYRFLWLLLTASYGLVNANAKFQLQSDSLLLKMGLQCVIEIPQLFYYKLRGQLVALMAEIVDDFSDTGKSDIVEKLLNDMESRFKFGAIVHGPGKCVLFGFIITQDDNFSSTIDVNDKL